MRVTVRVRFTFRVSVMVRVRVRVIAACTENVEERPDQHGCV